MAIVLSFGMLLTPLTADAAPQSVDPGQAREDFYEAVDAKLIAGMKLTMMHRNRLVLSVEK